MPRENRSGPSLGVNMRFPPRADMQCPLLARPARSAFRPDGEVRCRPVADIDLTSCSVLVSGDGWPEDAA